MTAAAAPHLRCWAEIDLAALERNLRVIRSSLPPHMRYVAVVKADAYGHGLHHVAARLMHAGADLFAVANVTEAAALRELGPGWPILVLSPLLPGEEQALIDSDLAAAVSSIEELYRFEEAAVRADRMIAVHVKIDTGMGRAGVWYEERRHFLRLWPRRPICGSPGSSPISRARRKTPSSPPNSVAAFCIRWMDCPG